MAVRRLLELRGLSVATTQRITLGTAASLRATVGPAAPNVIITFGIYRYDPLKRAYVVVSSIRRSSVGGVAALTWKPANRGSYYIRLTTSGTLDLAAGISAAYRWLIT